MRGERWLAFGVIGLAGLGASGCVSMGEHRRVKAANRTLEAEKAAMNQELFDERSVTDNLRTRIASLERENAANAELIANLRGENDLLDEMRRTAGNVLEDMMKRQNFSGGGIPLLPAPLDSALRRFAEAYPDAVIYDASRGTVKWKGDLLFPLGSAEVGSSSLAALRSFTDVLTSSAAAEFEAIVVGHTDNKPIQRPETRQKHPTNWHLSAHRAIAVGEILQKNGYTPERIGIMGCSEYRPITANSSDAGQSQNRRVEIYLVPRGSIVTTTMADAQLTRTQPTGGPVLGAP